MHKDSKLLSSTETEYNTTLRTFLKFKQWILFSSLWWEMFKTPTINGAINNVFVSSLLSKPHIINRIFLLMYSIFDEPVTQFPMIWSTSSAFLSSVTSQFIMASLLLIPYCVDVSICSFCSVPTIHFSCCK